MPSLDGQEGGVQSTEAVQIWERSHVASQRPMHPILEQQVGSKQKLKTCFHNKSHGRSQVIMI